MKQVNDITLEIKEKFERISSKLEIWKIFLNSDSPTNVSKKKFKIFLENQIANTTKDGVASLTEFIGRLFFFDENSNLNVSSKTCYSTAHGAEGFVFNFKDKDLYVYEAKSTDVTEGVDSKQNAHKKINEANNDLKSLGSSKEKLGDLESTKKM